MVSNNFLKKPEINVDFALYIALISDSFKVFKTLHQILYHV